MAIKGITPTQKAWLSTMGGSLTSGEVLPTGGTQSYAAVDAAAAASITSDVRSKMTTQPNYGNDNIAHTAGDPYKGYNAKTHSKFKALNKDPFSFSMRSYPIDITTNPEMGHYMLFYINVQDKTKYVYNGYNKQGESVQVGGVSKRWVEAVYDQVPATFYTAAEALELTRTSRTGKVFKAGDTKTFKKVKQEGTGKTVFEKVMEGPAGRYRKGPQYTRVARGAPGTIDNSGISTLAKGRKYGAMTGLSSYYPTTTRITDSIAIYLPANVTSGLGADYTPAETGMIGFAAASLGSAIGSTLGDDFEQGARALKGFISTMGKDIFNRAAAGVADAVANFASGGTDGGSYDLVQKAFGRATNPYMEVMFNKMKLRSFTYSFTFQPRSELERDEVQAIIKLFRFHMAPELQTDNMRFMGIPSTFDIHYMFQTSDEGESLDHTTAKENQYVNKIATCVLENCEVDYTSDGVKTFRDGSPTTITMALTFQETEIMTKDKIDLGF